MSVKLCLILSQLIFVYSKLILKDKFDNLDNWKVDINGKTADVDLIKSSVSGQKHELATEVTYCSGSCYRAEVKIKDDLREKIITKNEGEYWFGFSSMIPSDAKYKGGDFKSYNFQIHGGDNIGRPPIIGLRNEGKKMTVNVCGTGSRGDKDPDCKHFDIGDVKVGKWEHWVIYDRLSYSKSDGKVQIWRDGKKVLDEKSLKTSYNDKKSNYVKVGSYETDWKYTDDDDDVKTKLAAVNYAEIRVGDKNSNYDEVYTGN